LFGNTRSRDSKADAKFFREDSNDSEKLVELLHLHGGAQPRSKRIANQPDEDRELDRGPLLLINRNPRPAANDSKERLACP
jgi:hypothetical protein